MHRILKGNETQPHDEDQRMEKKRKGNRNKPVRFQGTKPVLVRVYKGKGVRFFHFSTSLLSLNHKLLFLLSKIILGRRNRGNRRR